jgi:hypothetical protein
LYVRPKEQRGEVMLPVGGTPTSDDFLGLESEFWEGTHHSNPHANAYPTVSLIDVETDEVIHSKIGMRCTGHNPGKNGPCSSVMRFIISFREYDNEPQWVIVDEEYPQCRECNTMPFSIDALKHKDPLNRKFDELDYLRTKFGVNVTIPMALGPTLVTIA